MDFKDYTKLVDASLAVKRARLLSLRVEHPMHSVVKGLIADTASDLSTSPGEDMAEAFRKFSDLVSEIMHKYPLVRNE